MAIRKRSWVSGGETKAAWVVDYFGNDLDESGHRKRKLATFRTKREAEDYEATIRPEIRQGIHVHHRAGLRVSEAADKWVDACEKGRDGEMPLRPHTLRQYRQHIAHIKPIIGARRVSELRKVDLEWFRDELIKRHSRALAAKILTSFKSILTVGGANAALMHDARKIKIKKHDRAGEEKVQPPEPSQIARILGKLDELATQTNKQYAKAWRRWRALIYAAAMTGMRQSELRGLSWEQVDFGKSLIRVTRSADESGTIQKPKTKSGRRDIPISSALRTILREWKLACPPGELVFPNWQGEVESGANIHNRCWSPLLERAKVPYMNFHRLRHFHASNLIASGANPKHVCTEMGHSSIKVTYDIYGHLFAEDHGQRQERADMMAARLLVR